MTRTIRLIRWDKSVFSMVESATANGLICVFECNSRLKCQTIDLFSGLRDGVRRRYEGDRDNNLSRGISVKHSVCGSSYFRCQSVSLERCRNLSNRKRKFLHPKLAQQSVVRFARPQQLIRVFEGLRWFTTFDSKFVKSVSRLW